MLRVNDVHHAESGEPEPGGDERVRRGQPRRSLHRRRECAVFGKAEYARLADVSVSHLYNLRHSLVYRSHRVAVHHTQARQVSTAERLQQQALRMTDTEAALRMQKAKLALLARCRQSR